MTLRRALVTLHLWLGLTVGLVWAVQGLTGALLVFHREAERLSLATPAAGPTLPPGRLIAAAEQAAGRPIRMLSVADAQGGLMLASYADAAGETRILTLDAATGAVLARRVAEPATPFAGTPWRWVYRLHETLLLGDRGEWLIGLSGLLLLTAALSGLWLGWPARGTWAAAFSPARWRTTRVRLYGWHRAGGLLAAAAFVLLAGSGMTMIVAKVLRPAPAMTTGVVRISPDAAWATARAVFPDGGFVRMTMPNAKANSYTVRLRRPGELRTWSGTTSVTVDAGDGRVTARYDALAAPLGRRLTDAAFPLHSGELAGLAGRLAVMAAGLALPMLYATGVLAWWRKRRRTPAQVGRRLRLGSDTVHSARPETVARSSI